MGRQSLLSSGGRVEIHGIDDGDGPAVVINDEDGGIAGGLDLDDIPEDLEEWDVPALVGFRVEGSDQVEPHVLPHDTARCFVGDGWILIKDPTLCVDPETGEMFHVDPE